MLFKTEILLFSNLTLRGDEVKKEKDKKVRDIKYNHNKYTLILTIILEILDVVMFCAIIDLTYFVHEWYMLIISLTIVALTSAWSIVSLVFIHKKKKYQLHEKKIMVNSLWNSVEIEYKNITNIHVTRTSEENDCDIMIEYVEKGKAKKKELHHITEDPEKLIYDIN